MEPQLAAKASSTAQLPSLPARRQSSRRPSTLHMVIEALWAQDQKKGVSVVTIKRFILAKYPSVDPIRLKYLLKQALSKGLSRGDLVRPPNSSAMGATGRFKLPPKKLQQKPQPRQTDPDREQALKLGQKGTTKPPQAAMSGAQEQGAKAAKKPKAAMKQKVKPVDTQPPAAAKPRSDGAKPLRAAARPRALGKGRSGPPVDPSAEDAGRGHGSNPGSASGHGVQRALVGKNKGKAPKREQQDPPKATGSQGKGGKAPKRERQDPPKATGSQGKGGKAPKRERQDPPKAIGSQGKGGKARVTPGAGQGGAGQQKAATTVGRKAP